MPKPTPVQFSMGMWILALSVSTVALVAWWSVRGGERLTGYDLFPLLGLLAFSLMWTHYIGGAMRRYWKLPPNSTQDYFTYTASAVSGLIVLHPSVFFVSLYKDGFGLPPGSYLGLYTDAIARTALLLGAFSLGIFLAYELHRKFSAAPWWKYVEYLNMAAMGAIFWHALTLGGELNVAWFRTLWLFYGLTFLAAISYSYIHKRRGDDAHEE